ncbi:MAG: ribonuclease III [Myxococcota bacterium]|nr:ribonuclease III [Myxococcota bacterium]
MRAPMDLDAEQERVARRLGHVFADARLLREALTHRSYANERGDGEGPRDNERLELLGDAVVGLVATSLLYTRFPRAREGELTRRRARLVCERTLAQLAVQIGIDRALRLGRGEERGGGRSKPRLLAGAFEACIGAVFLDAGFEAAASVLDPLLEPLVSTCASDEDDAKSRVQVVLQGRGGPEPQYVVLAVEGPDHARVYHVALTCDGQRLGEGRGRSKAAAEQEAAARALERLLGSSPADGPSTDRGESAPSATDGELTR